MLPRRLVVNPSPPNPPLEGEGFTPACVPHRARPNSVEFTQPRLPSPSSTSHISPSLLPVGSSIIPTSPSRTAPPLPSHCFSTPAGLFTVTACCASAPPASLGRPPRAQPPAG